VKKNTSLGVREGMVGEGQHTIPFGFKFFKLSFEILTVVQSLLTA